MAIFNAQTGNLNPFTGIAVGFYSTPTFADLDGDGDLDAIVGEFEGILNYYRNIGTATSPQYQAQTGSLNPFTGIDVGFYSAPTLADLDGDGDLDAIVGEQDGTLTYYRNTGTATSPQYQAQTGSLNPFNGIDVGGSSKPTFADLDGDGDLDAIVGARDGTLTYYRNDTPPPPPVFVPTPSSPNPFTGIDVGFYSAPTFADLDGDGDLDAIVGARDGTLNYYRNIGTATSPQYQAQTGSLNPFTGIDVGFYSAPTLADLDGDGDLDAIVGEQDGTLNYYRNTSTATSPQYEAQTGSLNPFNGIDVGSFSAPTFADLDGDGDLDAIVGARDGTLNSFENAPTLTLTAEINAAEPNTAGRFRLTLSQPAPDRGITVSYSLAGTATNGTDYTIPVTTTIAAGQTTATISVMPIDDLLIEASETIVLTLVDAPGYNLGATTAATLTLTSDDMLPRVTITTPAPTASERDSNPGIFRFSRTGPTTSALTVNYTIAGSASTSDYTPILTGNATIASGQSFVEVIITPVNDFLIEGNETVSLSLTDLDTYDLGAQTTATVTITDNDTAGFSLSKITATVSESGTTDSFTVVLTAQPTSDVVLAIAASDATEASVAPTTLTFTNANWNVAQNVTITGINDLLVDGNQTSNVTVSVLDASSDNAFDNLADQTVIITTLDNDVIINGTAGRDILTGGSTDDVITGFAGADTITTGLGRDTVVYTNIRDMGDSITDFAVGFDTIDLRQLYAGLNLNLSYVDAVNRGFLKFAAAGSNTIVQIDADGNAGAGRAVPLLTVQNVTPTALNSSSNFRLQDPLAPLSLSGLAQPS